MFVFCFKMSFVRREYKVVRGEYTPFGDFIYLCRHESKVTQTL